MDSPNFTSSCKFPTISIMLIAGLLASGLCSSDSFSFLFLSVWTPELEFSLPEEASDCFALPREGKLYLRDCSLVADISRSRSTVVHRIASFRQHRLRLGSKISESEEQMISGNNFIVSAGRQEVNVEWAGIIVNT